MPCPFDIPCEYAPKQSFEGMTNGEVMEAVFPKADEMYFTKEWWDAPYKGGDAE